MLTDRSAGVLLHPTSFDSLYGIGDLGPAAGRWIEWLQATGCKYWQVLPLGPTGYGDSPYQCFSSFAGNPMLISPEALAAEGWLDRAMLEPQPVGPIDFSELIGRKLELLDAAAAGFEPSDELATFFEEESHWLDDFALFMAIKEEQGGGPWISWPVPLRDRHEVALASARERLAGRVQAHMFRQYMFFRQWDGVRRHAAEAGIQIVGDLPIFVAHDSSDVWTHRHLFTVDDAGSLITMAGVPPDYFSPTGQLWGNPLYRWEEHEQQRYAWWIRRLRSTLRMTDVVRIDHFRAFADYWSIPAGAPTAETGEWLTGPGHSFFDTVGDQMGRLPIIAEDLGDLSPAVPALRDHYGLPGMKILQFAFDGDPENPFLPHLYPENCVVYTGTHDNETVQGWHRNASPAERQAAEAYVGGPDDFVWRMLATAWGSVAAWSVAPLQDFLGLGNEARMNTPGQPVGNWRWRYQPHHLSETLADRIRALNEATGR